MRRSDQTKNDPTTASPLVLREKHQGRFGRAFLIFVVCVLLFVISLKVTWEVGVYLSQNKLEKQYSLSNANVVIIDHETTEIPTAITDALSQLPTPVAHEIKKNWIFIISDVKLPGEYDASLVAGSTYANARAIWLAPDFTQNVLIHEIGHAFASFTALDYSKEFYELYDVFWDKCFELTTDTYSVYETSTPNELFALLFEQYLCAPEELHKNFQAGYEYMDKQLACLENDSQIRFFDPIVKYYRQISHMVRDTFQARSTSADLSNLENEVENNALINVSNYTPTTSFAGLNNQEKALLDCIFDAIENPHAYPVKTYNQTEVVVLGYQSYISNTTYNKITACVDTYLGQPHSEIIDIISSLDENRSTIYIHITRALLLEEDRRACLQNIDTILGTLHEGTETQKLLQIGKYINTKSVIYATTSGSVKDFLDQKSGDDLTQAMTFRWFCERIGIPCDIIFGYDKDGSCHTWNRVRLSDGSYRYYDIARFTQGKVDMQQNNDYLTIAINRYI